MSMSESDSDCETLVRLSSAPLEWETAPEAVEYKLKVKNNESNKWEKYAYTIKKGYPLPYSPPVEGSLAT